MNRITISTLAIAMMTMLASCDDEVKEDPAENQVVTYYQCDRLRKTDAEGNEVLVREFKYDEKGHIIWQSWVEQSYNSISEMEYDAQGRLVKQKTYKKGKEDYELLESYELSYPTDNRRELVIYDANGNVVEKEISFCDDAGRAIKTELYYADVETDELYLELCVDATYNEHGDVTRSKYVGYNNANYYREDATKYEYQTFGSITQYTRVEESRSFDGEDFYVTSLHELEYDEYGNNIRKTSYQNNTNNELNLVSDIRKEVDLDIPTDYTYGSRCTPMQPHCYTTEKGYDQYGHIIYINKYEYSIHHTEKKQ